MTDQSPPTVYVVCEVEWDNHGPVAVFTNAAAAEQHAGARGPAEVIPLPFLGVAPQRTVTHIHGGRMCFDHGQVEDERTWTEVCWDYEVPAEPRTVLVKQVGATRIHISAVTAESAEAAFREAVEKVRQQ